MGAPSDRIHPEEETSTMKIKAEQALELKDPEVEIRMV